MRSRLKYDPSPNPNKWLNNLKPGDHVYVRSNPSIYGSTMSLATVERLTKTLIITKRGERYRKKDGRVAGGDPWSSISLVEATGELMAEQKRFRIRKQRLAGLSGMVWRDMSDAFLKKVIILVELEKQKVPTKIDAG